MIKVLVVLILWRLWHGHSQGSMEKEHALGCLSCSVTPSKEILILLFVSLKMVERHFHGKIMKSCNCSSISLERHKDGGIA